MSIPYQNITVKKRQNENSIYKKFLLGNKGFYFFKISEWIETSLVLFLSFHFDSLK